MIPNMPQPGLRRVRFFPMVKIITDTTAVLPAQVAQQYDIPIISQLIHFGDEEFQEGIDISTDEFMRRLTTSKQLPKTAAPLPESFVREFARLVPLGQPILCIHPSADVSGTVRSALLAKSEFPGADIRVIDTRSIGSPLGTLVELAAGWAAAGESADAIVTRLASLTRRNRLYFLVATLEFLARGGRIGGASALLGSVLQVKPILEFKDGKVEVLERERTTRRALARLKELVTSQAAPGGQAHVTIMHAGVPEAGQALAADLQTLLRLNQPPLVSAVPPAIVTHGGPGILGVGFFAPE